MLELRVAIVGTKNRRHNVDRAWKRPIFCQKLKRRLQKDYLPLEESWGYHWVDRPLQYYVRSTVLGGAVLSEVNHTGKKLKTYVNAGGQTIAWQALVHPEQGSPVEMLMFEHYDPAGMSRRMTIENGNATSMEGLESDAAEFDPAGQSIGLWDLYPELPPPFPGEGCIGCGSNGIIGIDDNSYIYANGVRLKCTDTQSGQTMSCQNLLSLKAAQGDMDYHVGVDQRILNHFGMLRIPSLPNDRIRIDYGFLPKSSSPGIDSSEVNESRNMRHFREAVQAVRDILNQNGGDNPCANFFGGAGLDALENIVSEVTESSFVDLSSNSLGIQMRIPTQASREFVAIPSPAVSLQNLDGSTIPIPARHTAVSPTSDNRRLPVLINTRGPFISRFASRIGGYAPGRLRSRSLQLLHEIGHLTITATSAALRTLRDQNAVRVYWQLGLTHKLPLDGNDARLSETNTTAILEACRGQIDQLDD
ncbi:MAG: hypothetical protein KF881_07510 [Acidobacteria bacterium]|nr:hypothetical protein [Acidobacteriota bacterium]